MFKEADFDQIRPYYDNEVNSAIQRILSAPAFDLLFNYLPGEADKDQWRSWLSGINSVLDFQKMLMYPLVKSVVKATSTGLTTNGFENLKPHTPYLFVSNHRDIVLDSAILQALLVDHGHETSEITFGSNLMTDPFIIDFGKINRMFVVNRGGNNRELFQNSRLLSAYMRHTIANKKVSSWIAQRNGRTKDGNDKTEAGLLKMFHISGQDDFISSFHELNLVPVAVSYEFEPCCALKIKELSITTRGIAYHKKPEEDMNSIITGIRQPKGRIHFSVCRPVSPLLKEADKMKTLNDKISLLAKLMDKEIHANYMLWPNNYIAYDMLYDSSKHTAHYSEKDVKIFTDYMQNELDEVGDDVDLDTKRDLMLKIYANPVKNKKG